MAAAPESAPGLTPRQKLTLAAALLAMVASGVWIYYSQFAAADVNQPLHKAIGVVLAEETFHAVGHGGKVVIVTIPNGRAAELKVQIDAFLEHIKRLGGVTIADKVVLDPGDNPKYRAGAGLSTKHFLKIIRKHPAADAVVSFVGAPEVTADELKQLKSLPKFIAEARSPEKLGNLLKNKVLLAAVVPRFEFPAPGPRQPQTTRQWFDHYYQIVRVDTALPSDDTSP